MVLDHATEFDVIHSHLEWSSVILPGPRRCPSSATFHGRLDLPWARSVLEPSAPAHLVAISRIPGRRPPGAAWTIVHNGLTLSDAPFERRRSDDLCFVGRVNPEKGIVEAMEVAAMSGRRLRMAAKIGTTPAERDYNENVFQPALAAAGSSVEFLGELSGADRDALIAVELRHADAGVVAGAVRARRDRVARLWHAGHRPPRRRPRRDHPRGRRRVLRRRRHPARVHVARVAELDRAEIRASVIDRFSAARMADRYEALYRRMIGEEQTDEKRVVDIAARR